MAGETVVEKYETLGDHSCQHGHAGTKMIIKTFQFKNHLLPVEYKSSTGHCQNLTPLLAKQH